jgi:hypothetical protein
MNLLLYFTSFGAVLVLFASAVGVTVWTLRKSIRVTVRLYRPTQVKPIARTGCDQGHEHHPDHLKRAGH